jgi:hypothetical protein
MMGYNQYDGILEKPGQTIVVYPWERTCFVTIPWSKIG